MKNLYEDIKKILNEEDVENTPSKKYIDMILNENLNGDERVELLNILATKKFKYIYDNPEKFTLEKMYNKLERENRLDMFD